MIWMPDVSRQIKRIPTILRIKVQTILRIKVQTKE